MHIVLIDHFELQIDQSIDHKNFPIRMPDTFASPLCSTLCQHNLYNLLSQNFIMLLAFL